MAQQASTRLDGATSIDEVLAGIPADARLVLRDHIRGLEAEAGTARTLAAELQGSIDGLRRDRERLLARLVDLDTRLVPRLRMALINRARQAVR